jgi:hypothetical protein
MAQHKESTDDEGIQLTYSSLVPGKRLQTPAVALLHDVGPAPEPVHTSWGAWPHSYHRVLNLTFLSALFALGVLLGTVVSGYAASLRSPPMSAPMVSRPGVTSTLATQSGAVGVVPAPLTVAVDARFPIVTLSIRCLRNLCATLDGSQDVPAGLHVYALQGGWSCTTLSAVEVTERDEQYVYCRLDQPNVFTATFDGAPFDCVGSRLGCRFVMQVETTNGR